MPKLLRKEGDLPSSLCGNIFNALGIAKPILVWPKLTEWSNLKLWRVVAGQSRKKLEFLVKICKSICLSGFWICLWNIIEYHAIMQYCIKSVETANQVICLTLKRLWRGEGVPENFIDIPQVFRKIWRLSSPIWTILIKFLDILTFSYCK